MPRSLAILVAFAAWGATAIADTVADSGASPNALPQAVSATVTSSLASSGERIRQLAFDGDEGSYFLSDKTPTAADHFTLTLDQLVVVKSLRLVAGRPTGADKPAAGKPASSERSTDIDALDHTVLESSADSQHFEELRLIDPKPKERVRALRLRFGEGRKEPLMLREIVIDSDPPVARFKYPVEFLIDVSDAPEMRDWAERAAAICVRAYPMINEELASEGFQPPRIVRLALKNPGPGVPGVAAAGGGRITGNVKFFKEHPDDFGAMVHETVHIVQRYRGRRNNPGWLVEGVADYIRFFKYEPGKIGRLNVERARYDRSYRVTAAFLAFVTDKYDKQLVRKLNQAMREGRYKEDLFQEYTGKTVQELDAEWRTALRAKRPDGKKSNDQKPDEKKPDEKKLDEQQ